MPQNSPFDGDDAPIAEPNQEAYDLSPSTEAWIERMMQGMDRMHRDEAFRLEIAKRLS